MKTTDRYRYEMLARVREFGMNYGHLFPETTHATPLFTRVADIVGRLEACDLTEARASGAARATRKASARGALVRLLTRLDDSSRVLGGETPRLAARFDPRQRIRDHALLTLARQIAAECEPHAGEFIAHGLPASFRADLDQLIAGFDATLRERETSKEERFAARQQIADLIQDGLKAVRTLDLLVSNHLESDVVTRAVWQRDRRVLYPRSHKRTVTGEASTPSQPDAAATPAEPAA
jgi:hypothetical protein